MFFICPLANLHINSLFSTGTRIRTQIKGFGDLHTNRCTMPVFKSKVKIQKQKGKIPFLAFEFLLFI